MKMPATLIHGMMGVHRCPMCDKKFMDQKTLYHHAFNTIKHPSVLHEVWRLRFLLEEAERDNKILRGQRNEWRRIAQERRGYT